MASMSTRSTTAVAGRPSATAASRSTRRHRGVQVDPGDGGIQVDGRARSRRGRRSPRRAGSGRAAATTIATMTGTQPSSSVLDLASSSSRSSARRRGPARRTPSPGWNRVGTSGGRHSSRVTGAVHPVHRAHGHDGRPRRSRRPPRGRRRAPACASGAPAGATATGVVALTSYESPRTPRVLCSLGGLLSGTVPVRGPRRQGLPGNATAAHPAGVSPAQRHRICASIRFASQPGERGQRVLGRRPRRRTSTHRLLTRWPWPAITEWQVVTSAFAFSAMHHACLRVGGGRAASGRSRASSLRVLEVPVAGGV